MRTGLWLIGARGSVAVTCIVGALAIRQGLSGTAGCVTELPQFRSRFLPGLGELQFGGHDISPLSLAKRAQDLVTEGVLPAQTVDAVSSELAELEREILAAPTAASQMDIVKAITHDVVRFRERHELERVVMANVSTTEPPVPAMMGLDELSAAMRNQRVLAPSSVYAYAAMSAGCSYVDFTPSTGARLPALHELSLRQGVPYAGRDGKTGETLLKSVLAPMFAMRNLTVRSWSGINLLGGGDGAALAQPGANAAKIASKQRLLPEILGYHPEGLTRIDYVPDIGNLKTAWDLITFSGFLGTAMRLEFTWHGCDSALAAPLVLDLARLMAAAHAQDAVGPVPQLAFFFKDPLGDVPHGLADQWHLLCDWVAGWRDEA